MTQRPIYLGYGSITCEKEHKCIPNIKKPGIDTLEEARAIVKEILRDLKEGKTWNHSGKEIDMNLRRAIRRINYIKALAVKHGFPKHKMRELDRLLEKARIEAIEIAKRKRKIKNWDF